ncbi:hypothetical protein [Pedobacter sp. MW01-1-1]|uniref:hypothetical protein n=1 Tax=Pedobacter sp. MW01-1-1 TaxID=3383027 RepID=UPI003FEEC7C0
MKILITGANSAKAMKLLKAFPHHFVLLADYGDVPEILTENYAFKSLGALNKESIAHILLNFCLTESIDSIIPLHPYELEPLAKSAVLFQEYGIDVLLPSADEIEQYIDTEKTTFPDFAIFVKGESVFSSNGNKEHKTNLNGVFATDGQTFKLFTV